MSKILDSVREVEWSDIYHTCYPIEVPKFQRPYCWEKDHVDRYLETIMDIIKKKEERFLGNIILKKKNNGGFEIIDGQQRLTTNSLIIKAIHAICSDMTKEHESSLEVLSEDELSICKAIIHRIDSNGYLFKTDYKGSKEYFLRPLDFQKKYWPAIMDNPDNDEFFEIDDKSIARYKKNYNTIRGFILDQYLDEDGNNAQKLHNLLDELLTKLKIIYVLVDESGDEFEIFETINSIGLPLGLSDLVKNKLIASESPDGNHIYDKYWQDTFEKDNKEKYWDKEGPEPNNDEKHMEVFFKYYLTIVLDNYEKVRSNNGNALYSEYAKYIDKKNGSVEVEVQELKSYAEQYLSLMYNHNNYLKDKPNTKELLDIMKELGFSVFYPIILYYTKNTKNTKKIEQLSLLITNYTVRRICAKLDNVGFNYYLLGILKNVKNIENDLEKYIIPELYKYNEDDDNKNRCPNSNELKDKLVKDTLKAPHAKCVLRLLEKRLAKKNDGNGDTSNTITLEHIVPQNPDKWDIELKKGDSTRAFNKKIKNIGNLTLLSGTRNSSLSNSVWDIKITSYKKSNLIINKDLSGYEFGSDWKKAIDKRAKDLAKLIDESFRVG